LLEEQQQGRVVVAFSFFRTKAMKRRPESLPGREASPSDKDEMNLAEFPITLLTDRIP
jgi:hypothetical protein